MGFFDSLGNSIADGIGGVLSSATGGILDGVLDIFGLGSSSRAKDLSKYQMEQQHKYNKDFAMFQNDLQTNSSKDLMAFQSDLNNKTQRQLISDSPMLQVQGMKNAGLNPAMLNGAPSAPVANSAQATTAQTTPSAGLSDLASLINAQTQSRLADSQISLNEKKESNIESQNDLLVAQALAEGLRNNVTMKAFDDIVRSYGITNDTQRNMATKLFNEAESNIALRLYYLAQAEKAEKDKNVTDRGLDIEQQKANAQSSSALSSMIIAKAESAYKFQLTEQSKQTVKNLIEECALIKANASEADANARIKQLLAQSREELGVEYAKGQIIVEDVLDAIDHGVSVYSNARRGKMAGYLKTESNSVSHSFSHNDR